MAPEPEDEINEKNPRPLDEDDIALLKTYGLGRYSNSIKKVEKEIKEMAKKLNDLCGADIRSVITEAGMYVIRARRKTVTEKDFLDAVNKVIKGYQKFSATPNESLHIVQLMFMQGKERGPASSNCVAAVAHTPCTHVAAPLGKESVATLLIGYKFSVISMAAAADAPVPAPASDASTLSSMVAAAVLGGVATFVFGNLL